MNRITESARSFVARHLLFIVILLAFGNAAAIATGVYATYGAFIFTAHPAGSTLPGNNTVNCHNDEGPQPGLICNVPSGTSNGYQFQVGGTDALSFSGFGLFLPGQIQLGGPLYLQQSGVYVSMQSDANGNIFLIPNGGTVKTNGPFTPGWSAFTGTSGIYGTAGTLSGAPTFSAPNASLYLRYDGGTNAHLYVNTSGPNTTGTTWSPIAD